jgi:hypothetical protein
MKLQKKSSKFVKTFKNFEIFYMLSIPKSQEKPPNFFLSFLENRRR